MENYKKRASDVIMPLYPQKAVTLSHGEGMYLYDTDGKQYLDMAAGIAVSALGHSNQQLKDTIKGQIDQLMMCVGSYPTAPKVNAAELLVNNCCQEQVFFCNSGAEAVEGCLKLARKWAHEHKGPDCKEIIAFKGSFHGRTYGAASCTYKSKKQDYFAPYLPGIHFAEFNNLENVKALISDKTAAVIVEPVQGEGGLKPATPDFIQGLRDLCTEQEIIFISDEIQAGMGRLGTLWAHAYFDIEPDLVAIAKGMGAGFPVGAFLGKKKFTSAFAPGDHGTTYGGNPLATAVVHTVVSQIKEPAFLQHVREVGAYLMDGLNKLKTDTNSIEDVRGVGLMIGVDTVYDIGKLLNKLLEDGLIATQAGERTLRLTPPLIISKSEADEALDKFSHIIRKGDL